MITFLFEAYCGYKNKKYVEKYRNQKNTLENP